MHHRYFPICPVDGPIEPPVPFGHGCSQGAVPNKCSKCECLFEGECTRYFEGVKHYLHLDYGDCGIPGPTDPVVYEDDYVSSKVEIPRKCARCDFLAVDPIRGFSCTKDADKWGDLHRGLDWGTWTPNCVYLELDAPKVTTRLMSELAYKNDLLGFVQEHRRVNPGLSLVEAREDFAVFRQTIEDGEH